MRHSQSTPPGHCVRAAGLALVLSLGCARSEQLTFIPELDGASAADIALGSGGNPGATGGAPAGGSDGSGSGGMTTGGFGSGGMSTAGSGSGGMSGGGSVGTGADGAGGFAASGGAGGAAGHLGSGGSAGNSGGGASGGHKGTGGTAGHAGTGGTAGQAGGGTTGTGGGQAATFTQVYTMVLHAPSSSPSSCAGNGCHVSAAGAAGSRSIPRRTPTRRCSAGRSCPATRQPRSFIQTSQAARCREGAPNCPRRSSPWSPPGSMRAR